MRLTSKGRYAVTAMADLAVQQGAANLTAISARQGLSQAYLEQLFARLRRAGLVEASRGPGGGYRLARPPAHISIAAIIDAADEEISTTACGGAAPCNGKGEKCLTHDLWAALGGRITDFLEETSLEDVAAGRLAPAERSLAS